MPADAALVPRASVGLAGSPGITGSDDGVDPPPFEIGVLLDSNNGTAIRRGGRKFGGCGDGERRIGRSISWYECELPPFMPDRECGRSSRPSYLGMSGFQFEGNPNACGGW